MSVNDFNKLRLQLNTTNNTLTQNNSLIDEVEWAQGQDKYLIELEANTSEISSVVAILTDSKENIKELGVGSLREGCFNIDLYSLKNFKAGSIVKLAIAYKFLLDGAEVQYTTTYINIKITSSNLPEDDYVEPENTKFNATNLIDLLTKFSLAKGIEKVEVGTIDGETTLYITYIGDSERTKIGPICNLELLGIQNTSGGGQLGLGAFANKGFAGGRNSSTGQGASVGQRARSYRGVSIGPGAFSGLSNIAIGGSATVGYDSNSPADTVINKNGNGNIAIGVASSIYSKDTDSLEVTNNIAIGTGNTLEKVKNCIVIGSGSSTAVINPSTGTPAFTAEGANQIIKSEAAILIGTNVKEKYNNYGILIGNNINSKLVQYTNSDGLVPKQYFNHISIGNNSVSGERGCIAVGTGATAGCFLVEAEVEKNGTKVTNTYRISGCKEYPGQEPASIAIGRKTQASGHGAISLGRYAKSYYFNGIAIGAGAIAGVSYDKVSERPNTYNATGKGANSIAIGYQAKVTKDNAVQIGPGLNSTANSLQFGYGTERATAKTVMIVKDGAVQFDLGGKGAQGVLPVTKGGTGANTRTGARANLGIYTFGRTREIAGGKPIDGDMTISFAGYNFTEAPYLFLNLRILSGNVSPTLFSYYVKSVTKDKAVFAIQYRGDQDTKKNSKIKFGFYIMAIGNGVSV